MPFFISRKESPDNAQSGLVYAGLTDIGKKRSENQDSFRITPLPDGSMLFTVCDGMGGAAGGSTASALAAETFTNIIISGLSEYNDKVQENAESAIADTIGEEEAAPEENTVPDNIAELVLSFSEAIENDESGSAEIPDRSMPGTDVQNAEEAEAQPEPDIIPDAASPEEEPVECCADEEPDADEPSGKETTAEARSDESVPTAEAAGEAADETPECDVPAQEQEADTDTAEEHAPETAEKTPEADTPDIHALLREAACEANSMVYTLAQSDEKLRGMGTTLVAAVVRGSSITAVNIGDSRLYIVTKDGMRQVTRDHSFVQYLIDIGTITPEEAATNPRKNVITRAVGTSATVEADTYDIDISASDTAGGVWMLLCSDGLINFLSEHKIADIITNPRKTPEQKVEALIKGANNGGGGDNITAIIVKCL